MRLILFLFTILCSLQTYAFEYSFNGVKFNCSKVDKSSVKITSWNRGAKMVVVPSKVTDKKGNEYDVVAINVYSSGDNYMAEELVISEGVRELSRSCFLEFRKLKKVKLPTTLTTVEKNAFGNVKNNNIFEIPNESIKGILADSGIPYKDLPKPLSKTPTPPQITAPASALASSATPAPAPVHTPAPVSAPAHETLVVEVISMEDKGNIAGNTKDYRHFDSHGDPCAMIRVSVAKYNLSYDSSDIPNPQESNIRYNDKGYDKIWLVEGAKSIRIYSDKKEFEEKTIIFKDANKNIERLESARVYNLKLRIVPLK